MGTTSIACVGRNTPPLTHTDTKKTREGDMEGSGARISFSEKIVVINIQQMLTVVLIGLFSIFILLFTV